MKSRYQVLTLLAVVFVGSLSVSLITDPLSIVHTIAQYPAIVALFGALWKILQDEIRDQREIRKETMLTLNSLFAGSHYASRIYDKQISFCEGYWQRVLQAIKEMEREGESPKLVHMANELYTYRLDQAIWLNEQVMLSLESFEQALRTVGAESKRMETLPVGSERHERVEKMTKMFVQIMHIGNTSAEEKHAPSYLDVLAVVAKVLGIEKATTWRQDFLDKA